ncbi:hypothetical protein ND856_19035 [Leptospira bandrabouensis]|uniref:hypothetical protein n=1 Tax=Leptospira bandrabouensis TaxID=2484903 RepID=UPI00223E38E6|nr:hypothetical protein [Leptospira bandrabouensis]MCW7460393.1 hypothetical protein [Leptospira bandrabouensis]MCW7479403.1 hypothetical protein [Leptospira bandrabouensis]MCW7487080.1 hypothetical protein [Leptospira bandrabouensis]
MELNLDELKKDPKNLNAAISIRQTYYHAIETFLSLLLASLQAANYPLGWVLKYSNFELRSLVNKINNEERFFNFHKLKLINWQNIGYLIHRIEVQSEEDKPRIQQLINYWKSWGLFHTNQNSTIEYNSLKHGYRTKFGSTKINIDKLEIDPGKYGLNFFVAKSFESTEELKSKSNFYTEYTSSHWNPFRNCYEILLISCSINNVKNFLLPILQPEFKLVEYEIPKKEWLEEIENESEPELVNVRLTKAIRDIPISALLSRETILDSLKIFE